ncbi:MAG: YfiR family protein [Bacteroidota bacterium]
MKVQILSMLIFLCGHFTQSYGQVEKYKALFIYKFVQGMEWPVSKVSDTYKITVLGDDAVFNQLKTMIKGRFVNGKEIEVSKYKPGTPLENYVILFLGHSKRSLFENLQKEAVSSSTVLITETPGFAQKGSFINFNVESSKLKFELNKSSFNTSSVKVSGTLESLATIVN